MEYRIVEKPAFDVVGWPLRTTSVGGVNMVQIPAFWDRCNADGRVDALVPLCGDLGLLGLCAEMDPTTEEFTYFVAVEGRPDTSYPQGTRRYALPAATYAVFPSVGPMPHTIQETWKRAFSEWFPSSGYDHGGTPDFEVYPLFAPGDDRGVMDGPQCYTEVWIPIKKRR